ncbi:MAG: hypothetical protein FWD45_04260, partial [Coriobacteriia bacterium]|nr:hypothetical protein [Coriobacteriia bacterium]
MSRLLPQNLDIRGFNVTENVNATVPDGTVTSSIPLAEIPLVKKGIFYVGNNYTLDSSDVRFTGIAKATTDENGMGISPSSPESVTLLAGLEVLNRYKTIPPFKGTLVEYIDMVLSTVGYTGKRQVWWDSTREPLLIQGYSGNVFEYLSAFLTTLGYDMVWQGDYIAIYPWKRYIIDP